MTESKNLHFENHNICIHLIGTILNECMTINFVKHDQILIRWKFVKIACEQLA